MLYESSLIPECAVWKMGTDTISGTCECQTLIQLIMGWGRSFQRILQPFHCVGGRLKGSLTGLQILRHFSCWKLSPLWYMVPRFLDAFDSPESQLLLFSKAVYFLLDFPPYRTLWNFSQVPHKVFPSHKDPCSHCLIPLLAKHYLICSLHGVSGERLNLFLETEILSCL